MKARFRDHVPQSVPGKGEGCLLPWWCLGLEWFQNLDSLIFIDIFSRDHVMLRHVSVDTRHFWKVECLICFVCVFC